MYKFIGISPNSIIYLILLCLYSYLSLNYTIIKRITINKNDNVKEIIESGKRGDVFILKGGVYKNIPSIKVPDGISIIGENNVIFRRTIPFQYTPVFDLSNKSNILIKNISIELLSDSKGILLHSKNLSQNITFENITFTGNLQSIQVKEDLVSGTAIIIENAIDLEIKNCEFLESFGGIYMNNVKNVDVINNTFNQVNFGNIVSSNSENLRIHNNKIFEPGKGSKYHHPTGDGITFGGENRHISIKGNTIANGYCYLIWVVGKINNSIIDGNTFKSGVTTSLCINNGKEVNIMNNIFDSALGPGILLNNSYSDILIKNNDFYNDVIISRQAAATNINVIENNFFENYPEDNQIGAIGNITINEGNNIQIENQGLSSSLILIGENGKVIFSGDSYRFNKKLNQIKFKIKNIGSKSISFTGFPQIILNDSVLSKNFRGPRDSGGSYYRNLSIPSRFQPNVLILKKGEEAFFTLLRNDNMTTTTKSTIINIPTSSGRFNPFWIEIIENSPN